MTTEVLELAIALIVLALIMYVLRRASLKSRERAADRIFQSVKTGLSKADLDDADKIWMQIRKTSRDILAVDAKPMELTKKPFVLLVLGVNGVGKTTTIGKLAARWKADGKKVIL